MRVAFDIEPLYLSSDILNIGIDMEKICRECNERFEVFPSRASQKFCSQSCAMKYRNRANPKLRYSSRTKNNFNITDEARDYIDGLILSDANIQRGTSHATRLCQTFSARYGEWSNKIKEDLGKLGIKSRITKQRYFDRRTNKIYRTLLLQTKFYPQFHEFRNRWYSNGKKIVPHDLNLNNIVIKNWFLGDGGRPHETIQLSTDNFDEDSVNILLVKLEELGYKFRYTSGRLHLYKKSSVKEFIELVGEVPSCFSYKIGGDKVR